MHWMRLLLLGKRKFDQMDDLDLQSLLSDLQETLAPEPELKAPKDCKLREWVQLQRDAGRHPFSIIIALWLVSFLDELEDANELLKRLSSHRFSPNEIEDVQRYWEFTRSMWKDVSGPDGVGSRIDLFDFARSMQIGEHQLPKLTTEEFQEIVQMLSQENMQAFKGLIDNVLENALFDAHSGIGRSVFDEMMPEVPNTAMIFLIKIFLPCIIEYGVVPQDLFRQAVLGDKVAIEKMINLCRQSDSLPKIAEQFTICNGRKVDQDWLAGLQSKPVCPASSSPRTVLCAALKSVAVLSTLSTIFRDLDLDFSDIFRVLSRRNRHRTQRSLSQLPWLLIPIRKSDEKLGTVDLHQSHDVF